MDALNIRVINNHNQVIGTPDDPPGTPTVIGLLKETYNRLHTATENTNLDITNLQDRVTTLENTVDGSDTADPPIQGLSTRVEELENTVIEQTLSIQNNTDDISENRTNIARNGATILTLQNRLNDTNTEIGRVERSLSRDISTVSASATLGLETLSARVTQIDDSETGRLSVLETTVSNLVDEVEGQDGALEDITNLQADVSILDTNVGTLQTDVGTLQTNVGTLQTGVGTLQTNVGTLQTNVETLQTGVGTLQTGVGTLQTNVGTLQTGVGTLQTNVGTLQTDVGTLQIGVGTLQTNVGTLQTDVGTLQTDVGTLQTDVGTLQTTINNLHLGVGERTNQTGGERFNLYNSTGNTASGNYSHAEGYQTSAQGSCSHAEGTQCKATNHSSHAEGNNTTAGGMYSHAAGEYTYADSKSLTAVGRYNTWASGLGAQYTRLFLVGNGNSNSVRSEAFVVNYDGSVIINSTRSETNPSLIIGNNNIVSGKSSLAQGEDTYALGNYSLATGLGTFASSKCQTAIGKYNTTDPMGADIISRLFVVGNGNNDNDRSDAFTVYNSGEFGHNDVKMFMGDITLNVYYANSNHDITTFGVAYMTSNYKYCYISNVTIYVKFQGTFNINSIVVNGKTFKALDPSKNRGGGFATACADYQLNSLIYNCTLTHSGNTYYYLKWWQSYISPNSNFADRYWNISLYNCIFQDPTQYES